jgi:hypothetical protein
LLFPVPGSFASRKRDGVFGAVKGGRSPAQRILDGIGKVFLFNDLALNVSLASDPRVPSGGKDFRSGLGGFTRFGGMALPAPCGILLETAWGRADPLPFCSKRHGVALTRCRFGEMAQAGEELELAQQSGTKPGDHALYEA